jgi:hypothetical protein
MDVIKDLAYPLPVTVICEMLGVSSDAHAEIRQWSTDLPRSLDAIGMPADEGVVQWGRAARQAMLDYFRGLVPERRQMPRDDLPSLLIAAEEQGNRLTEGELLITCNLLFVAGHETTVNLMAIQPASVSIWVIVLAAHCHLGLGKLYRRTGKREQAQEHLATAVTMYLACSRTPRKFFRALTSRLCSGGVDVRQFVAG